MEYELRDAKRWARTTMSGYAPVVFTPYTASGEIDEDALRRDVDYTIALPSVGGLYVGSIY